MSSTGNITEQTGVVTFKLVIEGIEVTDQYGIHSIHITNECNRIPTAVLTILDGSVANQEFKASNDSMFKHGNAIEIKAGYNSIDETVFKGMIIKQNIKISSNTTVLVITCKDEAFKMTLGKTNRIFYDGKDSDAIEKLIKDTGLKAEVETTKSNYNELVQYQSSDWDFMMSRAQIAGAVVMVSEGEISVKKPVLTGEEVGKASFGNNLFSFDAEIDSRTQYASYNANTWDYSNQEIMTTKAENSGQISVGNLSESSLAEASGNRQENLNHSGHLSSEGLQAWADSKSLLQQLAMIRGTAELQGNAQLKAGELLKLEGISDRFNGKVFIGGVHHRIEEGNWLTTVQIGLDPDWFAERYNISALPASGMLPAISGLQVGVVTSIEGDPEGEHRIKVKIPIINAEEEGVWARVLSPYAGENYGMQFTPELGNEVLLGFLNDDPDQAVVLGSLFSNTNSSPLSLTDDNFEKIIMGNSEIKLLFNDETKTIKLETPLGKSITLDEENGVIQLEDDHNNKVVMNSDGISIESNGDINLSAVGDIKLEGTNVEASATANFKAEGSAGAEVSTSASAVIKGSIVQIN